MPCGRGDRDDTENVASRTTSGRDLVTHSLYSHSLVSFFLAHLGASRLLSSSKQLTMTLDGNFTFSSTDEYTQLLTELHTDYCRDQPEDVLQYCANFFNRKLEEQRVMFREQRNPMFQGKRECVCV